ncbi:MAG TPA: hypothetical protein VMW16_10145 [Sedimentisphaerales bacterium]|nr:hypothetical protein [Sedimentisphaerales bacterium]
MAVVRSALESRTQEREALCSRYRSKIVPNRDLDGTLVSFQASRKRAFYRWFKYKEGVAAQFVECIVRRLGRERGVLLDPFAGAGTALFEARKIRWEDDD